MAGGVCLPRCSLLLPSPPAPVLVASHKIRSLQNSMKNVGMLSLHVPVDSCRKEEAFVKNMCSWDVPVGGGNSTASYALPWNSFVLLNLLLLFKGVKPDISNKI